MNKMKTYLDANEVEAQITKPCEDCPFSRKSISGWLGGSSPAEYCLDAHQDSLIECHTKLMGGEPIQCAGAAIYRANVCKCCDGFSLPVDKERVFASPKEFLEHHTKSKLTDKKISKMTAEVFAKRIEAANNL